MVEPCSSVFVSVMELLLHAIFLYVEPSSSFFARLHSIHRANGTSLLAGPEQPSGRFRAALGFLRREKSERFHSRKQVCWFRMSALAQMGRKLSTARGPFLPVFAPTLSKLLCTEQIFWCILTHSPVFRRLSVRGGGRND